MEVKDKLSLEIQQMIGLWKGGTTLSRMGFDATNATRAGVNLRKIEELCINPYVKNAVVADIGTNGGGWLLRMLDEAKECHGVDIQSPEHTGFWRYMPANHHEKITYHQVHDFSCGNIKNNTLDFVFSHDVFCHISFSGAVEYLKTFFVKCKPGANLMIAIADRNKYKSESGKQKLMRTAGFSNWEDFADDFDGEPVTGRWYFYGPDMFSKEAQKIGFEVISKDVVREHDDFLAMVHLRKPDTP